MRRFIVASIPPEKANPCSFLLELRGNWSHSWIPKKPLTGTFTSFGELFGLCSKFIEKYLSAWVKFGKQFPGLRLIVRKLVAFIKNVKPVNHSIEDGNPTRINRWMAGKIELLHPHGAFWITPPTIAASRRRCILRYKRKAANCCWQ